MQLLYLLSTALPYVPTLLLYQSYGITAEVVMGALREEGAEDNTFRVECVLKCMGSLLCTVPPRADAWTSEKVCVSLVCVGRRPRCPIACLQL